MKIDASHMADLPIFPLPSTVLFPHTLLPLHVFEPRYRRLTAHCIGLDRPMGIVLLRPGFERDYHRQPAVFETGGLGRIVRYQMLPDGRYNILLVGIGRFHIEEEHPMTEPFRQARAVLLEDRTPPQWSTAVAASLDMLRSIATAMLVTRPSLSKTILDLLAASRDPTVVAHTLVTLGIDDVLAAQRVLEEPSVMKRMQVVLDGLLRNVVQQPSTLHQ